MPHPRHKRLLHMPIPLKMPTMPVMASLRRMTSPFMPLHITPHTNRLPAALMLTLERLLARVRMRVNLQTRGPGEGFAARGADVAVLGLWVGRLRGGADVVVVRGGFAAGPAPRVVGRGHRGRGVRGEGERVGVRVRREVGGEWSLGVEASCTGWGVLGVGRGVVGRVRDGAGRMVVRGLAE